MGKGMDGQIQSGLITNIGEVMTSIMLASNVDRDFAKKISKIYDEYMAEHNLSDIDDFTDEDNTAILTQVFDVLKEWAYQDEDEENK